MEEWGQIDALKSPKANKVSTDVNSGFKDILKHITNSRYIDFQMGSLAADVEATSMAAAEIPHW